MGPIEKQLYNSGKAPMSEKQLKEVQELDEMLSGMGGLSDELKKYQ
jgi:hypothetical protein